jgi:transcription initiation factor TFIIE subunit alpha
MSSLVSSEDIQAYCHDLVYQVAYAFYDTPYIILIKLLVQLGVLVRSRLEKPPADQIDLQRNL